MQGFLEETIYEDRTVRQYVRYALSVFVAEIMEGYQDYRQYPEPQSQNKNYMIGWQMAEKN